jgi:hypothetical protein
MKLQDILTPTLTLPHQGGGEKADSLWQDISETQHYIVLF